MYIIVFYPDAGSKLYYALHRGINYQFCSCRISCKHYKSKMKALHKLLEISDAIGYDSSHFDLEFLPYDLCVEWGLIREGGKK